MRRMIVLGALVLAACGDNDECAVIDAAPVPDAPAMPAQDPLCDVGSACGGDPRGAWELVAGCAYGYGGELLAGCSGDNVSIYTFSSHAQLTIAPDLTMSGTLVDETATGTAGVPLACAGVSTCTEVEASLATRDFTATCVGRGPVDACGVTTSIEGCLCDVQRAITNRPITGAFTLTGATTFRVALNGETFEGAFCVNGTDMTWHATRYGGVDVRYRFRRVP